MKRIFRLVSGFFLLLAVALVLIVYARYGGGKTYADLSSDPLLPSEALEVFFAYDEPIGNVAASRDTHSPVRVFMTVHPESRPQRWKVLEITGSTAVPYPDESSQKSLFQTVLGLYIDHQNRLWTIDHGNHGTGAVRLIAFDLSTNAIVHDYTFPREIAEVGSFFNDLTVTPDGRYVLIADVSFWRKQPSLVVYDVNARQSKSLLDGHPAVTTQNYVPVTPAKKMRFFGGLADLAPGIDGVDVSPDGRFVYWAAMSHDGLFRLPLAMVTDFSISQNTIAEAVERVADKPLSDGIRVTPDGTVLITDIEHQGIYAVDTTGKGFTLIKDPRIRWADGLSAGADGFWYLADSDIPNQMLQSKSHIALNKPYYVFKFKY